MNSLFLIFVLCMSLCVSAEKWCILVVGTKGYDHYRHQADMAHMYRYLITHGFDANHIILFSEDDAYNSPLNPFPGTLYNRPAGNGFPIEDFHENMYVSNQGINNNWQELSWTMWSYPYAYTLKDIMPDDELLFYYIGDGEYNFVVLNEDVIWLNDLGSAFQKTFDGAHKPGFIYVFLQAPYTHHLFEMKEYELIENLYATTSTSNDNSTQNQDDEGWCNPLVTDTEYLPFCVSTCFTNFILEYLEYSVEMLFWASFHWATTYYCDGTSGEYSDTTYNMTCTNFFNGTRPNFDRECHTDDHPNPTNPQAFNTFSNKGKHDKYTYKRDLYAQSLKSNKALANNTQVINEYKDELAYIKRVDDYFENVYTKIKQSNTKFSLNEIPTSKINMKCYRENFDYVYKKFGLRTYILKYAKVIQSLCDTVPDLLTYME